MRNFSRVGWCLVVVDLIAAGSLFFAKDIGDAATRGLGQGFGSALGIIALAAAALLFWGARAEGRGIALVVGCAIAGAPVAMTVFLTVSNQGLGLIFPDLRPPVREMEPSPQYAYPDAATREAALALVLGDYEKLAALLRSTPAPDLMARDERGQSLLVLATRTAIADGGRLEELEGLRLILAAGARPQADDLIGDEALIETVARASNEHAATALEMLIDAGLSPDWPTPEGSSVLFHERLAPAAARVLIARGVKRDVRESRMDRADWSPVTYHADLRRWATALVLLEGGVPPDHGTPPGSVLARVLRNGESQITDADRADPAFKALMAAARR